MLRRPPDNSSSNTQMVFFLGENRCGISACEIVKSHSASLNRFRRFSRRHEICENRQITTEAKSPRGPTALQDLFHSVGWMI